MAVVKADAYGHGLLPSARAARARRSHLARRRPAARGRRAAAGRGRGAAALVAARAGSGLHRGASTWASTSASRRRGRSTRCSRRPPSTGRTARVHLKVDTGLGRNGAWDADLDGTPRHPRRAPRPRAPSRSSGCSATSPTPTPRSTPRCAPSRSGSRASSARPSAAGMRPQVRHLANSAATLTNPSAHYDLVRPGCRGLRALAGPRPRGARGLRAARGDAARRAAVQRQGLPCGTGRLVRPRLHHDRADTKLGLVPMGYSDGVPRHATNVGPVQVGGRRYAVAGRVCMDQFVLDLGADSHGRGGDEVVLFGVGAGGEPTAQDWAAAIDTINYEIVTRVGARVPRVYLGRRASEPRQPQPRRARASVWPPPAWPPRPASRRAGSARSGTRGCRCWRPPGAYAHTPDKEFVVVADDGVPLHVEVDEPAADAASADKPTVVFSHGFCLSLESWVLQRKALVRDGLPRRRLGPARARARPGAAARRPATSTSSGATCTASSRRRPPRGSSSSSVTRWVA